MTKEIQKKEKRQGINPVFAAVTGALIGASVAITGALTFKDKKNRDKAKKVLIDVKNKSQDFLKKAEDLLKEEETELKPKIVKAKKKIKKIVKNDVIKGVKKI